jgi:hypothetical protein
MFKKREVKGNIRRKVETHDDSPDADNEDDELNFNAIADVKDRQQQRKRIKHEFTELQHIDGSHTKSQGKSEAVKSIESMMDNQFLAKSRDDHKVITHEGIMEKYISEKLGLLVK